MNPMQHQMKDPASGVPRELLPHLHLVSKHRYPSLHNPSLETIVGYLLEAPKLVRESQPVQWQYLDCPQDGTIFLTWQPPDLGVNFASDGFIWADQEAPFNSDVRGYTLQMFMHKAGFRPQAEPTAAHCRRRYRLLPSQQSMGSPMPDPSLWLIHYAKAAPRDHIPATSIPIAPAIHTQMQQRRAVMSAGALARKEFMLHDRANWPTINPPGGVGRHGPPGQMGPGGHRRGQSLAGHEPTIEEEEDVSRGDALDFMTPRDVSRMRYEQYHEWMEEILESPYRTMQIVPPNLGLGRKGGLESLTKDFFQTPLGPSTESGADGITSRVGRLDPGKAEEFNKLANQRLADMQQELQKMKQAHLRRMEKLKLVTSLSMAERKLRTVPSESAQRKSAAGGAANAGDAASDPIDDIVTEVEESTGKKIERVKNVTCVSKGGYQELQVSAPPAVEQPQNAVPARPASSLPAAGVQSQQTTTPQTQQLQSQPPPPPSSAAAAAAQPSSSLSQQNGGASQPLGLGHPPQSVPGTDQAPMPQSSEDSNQDGGPADIDMAGMDDDDDQGNDGLGDPSDWVIVDDAALPDSMDTPSLDHLAKSVGGEGQAQDDTPGGTGFTPALSENQTPQTLGDQQHQVQSTDQQHTGNTPLDPDAFAFDDEVNTAGDALADYGADDDLDLDNMDDSAFGDAFHHTEDNDLS